MPVEGPVVIRWSRIPLLLAFSAAFVLLMQAGRWADWLVHALLGIAFALASIYTVVRFLRGQPHSTDATIGLPSSIRRWLYGE
jgi:hypothetical protein